MKKILITEGEYAIVDDEDFIYLNRFKWHIVKDRYKTICVKTGLRDIEYSKHSVGLIMHFLLITRKPHYRIIHRNGNGLDNRKSNLMLVKENNIANLRPKKKETTSQYKGVSWDKKRKMWQSQIKDNYRSIFLGRYHSEEDAAEVYNIKCKEIYGDTAYQNNLTRPRVL